MASTFGRIEKLPSGRYRARYQDPTPGSTARIPAPSTFATKGAARQWLAARQTEIAAETWIHPDHAAQQAARSAETFGSYAARWVRERTNSKGEPLRPRTRKEYERMLNSEAGFLTEWRATPLSQIRPEDVRAWRSEKVATGSVTQTARAYDLMKSVLKTAVEDGLLDANPCRVKGGSVTRTGRAVTPPTEAELDIIIEAIEPKYKPLVIIAAAGGLRYGEVLALTTDDVVIEHDAAGAVDAVRIAVTKSVTERPGLPREAGPVKSAAGARVIAIFGRDAQVVAAHVEERDGLLWTSTSGGYVPQSSVNNAWRKARAAAGRPDLAFHALRHYAGTRYAQSGATVAETMARLGHASVKAAMRYQHADGRGDELARRAAR